MGVVRGLQEITTWRTPFHRRRVENFWKLTLFMNGFRNHLTQNCCSVYYRSIFQFTGVIYSNMSIDDENQNLYRNKFNKTCTRKRYIFFPCTVFFLSSSFFLNHTIMLRTVQRQFTVFASCGLWSIKYTLNVPARFTAETIGLNVFITHSHLYWPIWKIKTIKK